MRRWWHAREQTTHAVVARFLFVAAGTFAFTAYLARLVRFIVTIKYSVYVRGILYLENARNFGNNGAASLTINAKHNSLFASSPPRSNSRHCTARFIECLLLVKIFFKKGATLMTHL